MKKYLYLGKKEWAETWVNGGEIPINLASTYLSDDRVGTKTPDETKMLKGEVPLSDIAHVVRFGDNVSYKNFNFIGNVYNGQKMPNLTNAHRYDEDGLILSFCNQCSDKIAHKLGKEICVEIIDIEKTKKEIDSQLGVVGIMGDCRYTNNHERSAFLKYKADSWQEEYRIYWKNQSESRTVTIPSGTAKIVWTLR